jgi:hypothetical protein
MTEEARFNSYQGVTGQQSALRSRLKRYARIVDETYVELGLVDAPSVPHIRKHTRMFLSYHIITAAPLHSSSYSRVSISTPRRLNHYEYSRAPPVPVRP